MANISFSGLNAVYKAIEADPRANQAVAESSTMAELREKLIPLLLQLLVGMAIAKVLAWLQSPKLPGAKK